MRYGLTIVALLMTPPVLAGPRLSPPMPQSPAEIPDCTCRYFGQDKQLGETVCIRRNGSYRIARCTRVLNNTHWEVLDDECPSA